MTFHEIPTLMATFLAIGVTLTGVIWTGLLTRKSNGITQNSNTITRKSNELLEKDLSLKNRPWLVISEPYIIIIKGDKGNFTKEEFLKLNFKQQDACKIHTICWGFTVKNTGLAPATNIIFHSLHSKTKLNKDDSKDVIPNIEKGIIIPNQETKYQTNVSIDNLDQVQDNWYIFTFTYEFLDHQHNPKINSVGIIRKYDRLAWSVGESWIDF